MDGRRRAFLAAALNAAGHAGERPITGDDLEMLPAAGVAHRHLLIRGTGKLLRLPRLSQSGRAAADNLHYQAACFARAQPSGVTPAIHGVIAPADSCPLGALVVSAVIGGAARMPDDLPAIAHCLAAIHRLPPVDESAPLPVHADPVAATLAAIDQQAEWLDAAQIDLAAARLIRAEIAAAHAARRPDPPAWPRLPPLVVSDAHPGNYLIDDAGKAWFVDLEKAAYGQPAIDVAHVTLPTSVGWDRRVNGTVAAGDVGAFEVAYLDALPAALAAAVEPWLAPMRRLTWLRTVTWFVRWLARSARTGDPWSAADLPVALRTHMADHVRRSLTPDTLAHMQEGLPAC